MSHEYRVLAALSASAGRVLSWQRVLRRVGGLEGDAGVRPMRAGIGAIRRKLGGDDNPTNIFTGFVLDTGYRRRICRNW